MIWWLGYKGGGRDLVHPSLFYTGLSVGKKTTMRGIASLSLSSLIWIEDRDGEHLVLSRGIDIFDV